MNCATKKKKFLAWATSQKNKSEDTPTEQGTEDERPHRPYLMTISHFFRVFQQLRHDDDHRVENAPRVS